MKIGASLFKIDREKILEELQVNCCLTTIQNRLQEVGLQASKPARKLLLTEPDATARLRLCEQNIDRDWTAITFTDEKHCIRILQDIILPSVRFISPEEELKEIFVIRDNSAIHKRREVVQWFEEMTLLLWTGLPDSWT
ncbi:hypothetical protein Trydic_g4646 [Trypoxylus dichotomus]